MDWTFRSFRNRQILSPGSPVIVHAFTCERPLRISLLQLLRIPNVNNILLRIALNGSRGLRFLVERSLTQERREARTNDSSAKEEPEEEREKNAMHFEFGRGGYREKVKIGREFERKELM